MTTTPQPSFDVISPVGTSVGPWVIPFSFADRDDVWLYVLTNGVAGPDLIEDVDYTLTAPDPANGGVFELSSAVVPPGGWTEAHKLVVRRFTARRQGVALPDVEGHKPRATELALDRAMRIAQEVSDELDLALKVQPGGTAPDLTLLGQAGEILEQAQAAAGAVADKLDRTGMGADPVFAANVPFRPAVNQPAELTLAQALDVVAPLSPSLFAGTGWEKLARASVRGGQKGRAVNLPSGSVFDITEQLPVQTTWIADGPVEVTASAPTPFGILPGRIIQFSGAADDLGLGAPYSANPLYIGAYSKAANRQYKALTGRADPLGEASLAVMSEWGHAAGLFYSRTSDAPGPGFGTMGVFSYVINDWAGGDRAAAAHYVEAIRLPGSGYTYGVEYDVMNLGEEVQITPGNIYAPRSSGAIWAASGGEPGPGVTMSAASYALAIVNNYGTFLKGIVFGNNSLKRNAGGLGEAISLGPDMLIRSYAANDQIHSQILFSGDGVNNRIRMSFTHLGFALSELVNGANLFQVSAGGFQLGPEAAPWINRPSPGNLVLHEGVNMERGLVVKGDDGQQKFAAYTAGIGFYGASPVARATVTGSRGGSAALADLINKLAATGLIADGTSA